MSDPIEVEVGGSVAVDSTAQFDAQFPGTTATATAAFNFPYNGTILQYNQGDSFVVTPDLLAALTAAGAPISQP
ncbi:hypothetical protein [Cupriavidus metallidurans]|jgi:hypothetical protein|uniref:Uncharacterized protein n=1 Tax=Cupriavidus metallidurans TaxID=119219 RepID=A0A482IP06_9BURK|nr:hypothetical protein [Cupriavidus metallidurans]QBP09367.1 hypothetical protein DDF84_006155 [Cupriavidus metallidurans]